MTTTDPEQLLTAKQVAAVLQLSLRTVWNHLSAARLPEPIRIGSRVRWRRAELTDWVEAGCPDRKTWAAMCAARK